jgi:hypothetical protein
MSGHDIGRRRALRLAAIAVACVPLRATGQPSAAARDPREVHGALDVYAGEGVVLAWAILRGRDEATTRVLVRVEADPDAYGALSVTGVDPFTKDTVPMMAQRPLAGRVQFYASRARFADHPRTEWRFWHERAPSADAAPKLLVYYQGVPDTTPEFDDVAKLDAYLTQRIAKARNETPRRPAR